MSDTQIYTSGSFTKIRFQSSKNMFFYLTSTPYLENDWRFEVGLYSSPFIFSLLRQPPRFPRLKHITYYENDFLLLFTELVHRCVLFG